MTCLLSIIALIALFLSTRLSHYKNKLPTYNIGWICHSHSNMDTHLLHASSFSTAFSRLLLSSVFFFVNMDTHLLHASSFFAFSCFFLFCMYAYFFVSSFSFSPQPCVILIHRCNHSKDRPKCSGLSELTRIGNHSEVVSGQCLCSARICLTLLCRWHTQCPIV